MVAVLRSSSIGSEYSYTCLESAALVLRIAKLMDYRLQGDGDVDIFFRQLEALERRKLKCISFNSKFVIAIEGLPNSGKTKLAKSFERSFERVKILSQDSIEFVNAVRDIFQSLPDPILQAFNFVVNYFIAAKIVDDNEYPDTLYLIEKYHLNFLVRNLIAAIPDEGTLANLSSSSYFEWILDLPVPYAVSELFSRFLFISFLK